MRRSWGPLRVRKGRSHNTLADKIGTGGCKKAASRRTPKKPALLPAEYSSKETKGGQEKFAKRVKPRGAGLAVGRGVEGDVDDGFEFDRDSLFGGGAEFPLAEGLHGVGVELGVEATNQLNAVD